MRIGQQKQQIAERVGNPTWVIGIGASAGGLEALIGVIRTLPAELPCAIIVAQHLSPTHRSLLPQLLARDSRMHIEEARDGQPLQSGVAYIAPANTHITVRQNHLHLEQPEAAHTPKPSVDVLFQSIAQAFGSRAIGVILSGTGHDGAIGVAAIHAGGGQVLAQDASAKYSGMPQAAINTRQVTAVLPPEQIGAALATLVSGSMQIQPVTPVAALTEQAGAKARIVAKVLELTGLNLGLYKDSTFERRLARRLRATRSASLDEYLNLLQTSADEARRMRDDMLVTVTGFMRDAQAFEMLREVIDDIVARKRGDDIRVWVPGCATGEEAYSIALLIAEALGDNWHEQSVRIFATDLNSVALAHGRRAIYDSAALAPLGEARITRFFEPCGSGHVIAAPIRSWVTFSLHDLTRDAPFARVDLVSCRNVLIYLRPELNRVVFDQFCFAVAPGGYLFVGQAEGLVDIEARFEPIRPGARIFKRRDGVHPPLINRLPQPVIRPATAPSPARPIETEVLRGLVAGANALAVLLDRDGQITQVFGESDGLLRLQPGKPSLAIDQTIISELRAEVTRMRAKSAQSRQPERSRPKRLKKQDTFVRVISVPLYCDGAAPALAAVELLLFERWDVPRLTGSRIVADEAYEQSLTEAREYIDTLNERHSATTEELHSLNEELQSSNEELQSSNEELETTNEELQAANEELLTLNEEYAAKSRSLAETAALLDGIMHTLPYGVVVVDRAQRVIAANRLSLAIFPGIDAAIGQPLYSVPTTLPLLNLSERIGAVLADGEPVSTEINDQRSYQLRIQRVTDASSGLDGASITFVEVTEQKRLEAQNLDRQAHFVNVIAHSPALTYIKSVRGDLLLANAAFARAFGVLDTELTGKHMSDILPAELAGEMDARDREALRFDADLTTEEVFSINGVARTYLMTRYPVRNRDGSVYGLCVKAVDVTQLRRDKQMIHLQSQALDRSANGITIVDIRQLEAPIVYANDTFLRITGYSAGEVLGRNCRFLQRDDRDQASLVEIRDAIANQRTVRVRLRNYRKDGSMFWCDLSLYPLCDEQGQPAHYVGVLQDVTRAVAAEEATKLDQERLRIAQTLARVGMFELDLRTKQLVCTEINLQLLGFDQSVDMISYEELLERVHRLDIDRYRQAVVDCIAGDAELNIEYRVQWPDGTVRWLHTRGNVTLDREGRAVKLLGLSQDITQRRESDEQLRHIAEHDALTGLPNRTLFTDRLSQALLHARRNGGRVAVLFLDIDHFKDVNDTLGHEIGDRLLQQLATRLRQVLREEDTVSRQGGDEFVILLNHIHSAADVQPLAQKLIDVASQRYQIDDHELHVTPSIGVSLFPDDGDSAADLLRNADTAMYDAKRKGRGRFEFFNSAMAMQAQERLSVTNALRAAIPRHELELYYQPICDLATLDVIGVEALARWRNGDGLRTPTEFLPKLGDSSVLIELGWWAMRRAVSHLRDWRDRGLKVAQVAINVAPQHFHDRRFFDFLIDTTREFDIDPSSINLEITEQAMMGAEPDVMALLERLHQHRFLLSVDDFGTGYSNLSYLKRLPLDFLKIDRSFVEGLPEDKDDMAIVGAVLSIARTMGLKVIAEGVEQPEQLEFLRGAGCSAAQGFYLCKPAPAAGIAALLAAPVLPLGRKSARTGGLAQRVSR